MPEAMLDSPAARPDVPTIHDARAALRQVWGFDGFVGRQQEAVQAALDRRDTLVVFPTGAGKSITYQLPALLERGTAVVVSPLIALMKDQVDALRANGVSAAALNSSMSADARGATLQALRGGRLDLLYVSPEGLLTETVISLLKTVSLAFFAIDEAHCISHWGHDFRVEYRELGRLREIFGDVPIHACTATATPAVRDDIVRNLRLRDAIVLVSSFDRPNLTYRFVARTNPRKQLEDVLERHRGNAGIIYCLSRKDVEATCASIVARGWKAVPYHAGMSAEDRRRNQDAFASERIDIVVATVAFGMGIDRSNVRFVLHTGMPKSVEHYQQEAGRAGRDGLPAECVLLHSGHDVALWHSLLGQSGRFADQRADPVEVDRVALDKLRDMYRLCRALTCRHRALLRYFGQDTEQEDCGACDVCFGEHVVLDDSVTVARKILSAVARLKERFGARYVADVLKGSSQAKILQNEHNQLSTWGLLAEHSTDAIGDWIDQLMASGHLERGDREYPTLKLTDEGRRLMRDGQGVVALSVPRVATRGQKAERSTPTGDLPPTNVELFETLRAVRRGLAHARGVPPFVIFSDASLVDMARRCPCDEAAFRRVKGVGDVKSADLAPHFLPPIQAWAAAHGHAGAASAPSADSATKALSTRTSAYELFAAGTPLDEVIARLGRSASSAEHYLIEYVRDRRVDLTPWLDPQQLAQALPLLRTSEDQRLRPIYEALNGQVSYLQLRLARIHLERESSLRTPPSEDDVPT